MLKLAAIGDCCIDIYPQLNKYFLGGTSYNLCLSAQKLNIDTSLISTIGTDQFGKNFLISCHKNQINTHYLSIKKGKTSTVQINLDNQHRPIFHDWNLGVLKSFTLTQKQLNFISTQDVARCICLKPLVKVFKQFCQLKIKGFKVADFSGGTKYSPSIKIINQTFPFLDLIVTSQSPENKQILKDLQALARKHNKICLVTLGARGSQIFTPNQTFFQPSIKTKTKDTTGAGDTYLANFLIHYLKTKNIPQAMKLATQAAAEKITRLGASS